MLSILENGMLTRFESPNGFLPRNDWSDRGVEDVLARMCKFLRADCWMEFNADCPDGVFYSPFLALNNLLQIEFTDLREFFGGGGTHGWGVDINMGSCYFFGSRDTGLKRDTWLVKDPNGFFTARPAQHRCSVQVIALLRCRVPASHFLCL